MSSLMTSMMRTKSSDVLTQIEHALLGTDEKEEVEYMAGNETDASTQVTLS